MSILNGSAQNPDTEGLVELGKDKDMKKTFGHDPVCRRSHYARIELDYRACFRASAGLLAKRCGYCA